MGHGGLSLYPSYRENLSKDSDPGPGWPGHEYKTLFKNYKAKQGWDVAEVVVQVMGCLSA
jgi:hypothetical protein